MPIGTTAAIALGSAASGIGGGLLAGRPRTTRVEQTFDPSASGIRTQLGGLLSEKLQQPLSIDPNLLAQGLSGLNQAYSSGLEGLQSEFSRRGLGQSGLFGGSISNLSLARMGKVGEFLNQLSGTAVDRQNQTISQALALASPTGQTNVQQGSFLGGLGGGLNDLSSTLGLLLALGKIGGKSSTVPSAHDYYTNYYPSGGTFNFSNKRPV